MNLKNTDRRDAASTRRLLPVLCVIFGLPSAASAQQSHRLFEIERSLNANIVCYDAEVSKKGLFRGFDPISVYWIMNARDGHQENLTWFERAHVYGYSVKVNSDRTSLSLRIEALDSRPIFVPIIDGQPRAEIEISGRRAILDKIYVKGGGSLFNPVDWIRVSGRDPDTNAPVSETLHP